MGQRKARFAAAACMVSISLMLGAYRSYAKKTVLRA